MVEVRVLHVRAPEGYLHGCRVFGLQEVSRVIALVLALSLGQADAGALDGGSLDAGAPVEQLYAKCDETDVPLATVIDGGIDEPWARVKFNNCKIAACESFANDRLTATEGSPGTVLALVGGGVAVAVLAFIVGFVVPHPK